MADNDAKIEPMALTIKAACRALSGDVDPISKATMYRMIHRGDVVAIKSGGRTLVLVDSLRAYVANAPRVQPHEITEDSGN